SYAPGFIFTTALPPAICAAAAAAIRHLKSSDWERERHQDRAGRTKAVLVAAGLPVMPSDTHIVPVLVGDPEKCKEASDLLLSEHNTSIQPINSPTVPRGMERLRITPSPYHDDNLIDALASALVDVWERLELPLKRSPAAEEREPSLAIVARRAASMAARFAHDDAHEGGGGLGPGLLHDGRAVHVDGAWADAEVAAGFLVRRAGCDLGQHLTLARCEHVATGKRYRCHAAAGAARLAPLPCFDRLAHAGHDRVGIERLLDEVE